MSQLMSRDQLARRSVLWVFLVLLGVTLLFAVSFFGQLKQNEEHNARVLGLIGEHVVAQSQEYLVRNDLLALGAYLQKSVNHYDELSAVIVSDGARQILAKAGNSKGDASFEQGVSLRGAANGKVELWLESKQRRNYLAIFFSWLLCCFGLSSLWRYLKQLPEAPLLDFHQIAPDPLDSSTKESGMDGDALSADGSDESGVVGLPINVYIQAKNVKRLKSIVSASVFDSVLQQYVHIMKSSAALYLGELEQLDEELWKVSIPFVNNESQSVVKALSCASVFVDACHLLDEQSETAGPSLDFHVLVNNISRQAVHDDVDEIEHKLLVNAALCDWEYVNERVQMLGDDIDWNGMDYIPCQLQSELKAIAENHASQLVQHVI